MRRDGSAAMEKSAKTPKTSPTLRDECEDIERAAVLGDSEPLHDVVLGSVPKEGVAHRGVSEHRADDRRRVVRGRDGVVIDLVHNGTDSVEPPIARRAGESTACSEK